MFMYNIMCIATLHNNVNHSIIGTTDLLARHTAIGQSIDDGEEDYATITTCNKDTGGKRRLQQWTRGVWGVWFCVRGGGHIQMWQPLYK